MRRTGGHGGHPGHSAKPGWRSRMGLRGGGGRTGNRSPASAPPHDEPRTGPKVLASPKACKDRDTASAVWNGMKTCRGRTKSRSSALAAASSSPKPWARCRSGSRRRTWPRSNARCRRTRPPVRVTCRRRWRVSTANGRDESSLPGSILPERAAVPPSPAGRLGESIARLSPTRPCATRTSPCAG